MIKLITIASLAIPTIAVSETHHYKSTVCYDIEYRDCETLNEYDYDDDLEVRGRGKNGSGLKHLVDSVLSFVGDGVKGIGSAIDSLASEARRAGYTKFTATLSGPKGTATFTYHLEGGDWSIAQKAAKPHIKTLHGNEPRTRKPRVSPEE